MFWTDSYFVYSVREARRDAIRKYIETQGSKPQAIHPRS